MLPAAFEERRRQQPKQRGPRCAQSLAGGGIFRLLPRRWGQRANGGGEEPRLSCKDENLVNPGKNQAESWIITAVSAKVKGTGWGYTRHIPGEQRSTCGASPKPRAVSMATTDSHFRPVYLRVMQRNPRSFSSKLARTFSFRSFFWNPTALFFMIFSSL